MVTQAWATLGEDVARASGMVAVQARCSMDDALLLLRRHAELTGRDLDDVAIAVIARDVAFVSLAERPDSAWAS